MIRTMIKLLIVLLHLPYAQALSKVLVPSVYKEWEHGAPEWATSAEIQQQHNFSVFLYQKLDPTLPHYFEFNRGAECGTYLKYIVDHYDSFPDVAMFVHSKPEKHQKKLSWLHMLSCVAPTATFMNINDQSWVTRSPSSWRKIEQWTEQCWRDILQTVWELQGDQREFLRRLPPDRDIWMSAPCCNQFVLSRDMVRRRPLQVWQDLLRIIGVQDACHMGEPDYENLYFFNKTGRAKAGAEPREVAQVGGGVIHAAGIGRMTQAMSLEHLSHVVFGHKPLDMEVHSQRDYCENFLPASQCPGSPCEA